MDETGKKLLNLMFKDGDTVCASPNQYGYHSMPLAMAMSDRVTLIPTPDSCRKRNIEWNEKAFEYIHSEKLLLIALNPIQGFRLDENCYAYRNFLVEMDTGDLSEQLQYVKAIGMPYSAVVFSGGKSLHFLISLDIDLPDQKAWRKIAEWILNIATLADQQTKNPSRSIRIPGAFREPGKQQKLVEFKGKVKFDELKDWLLKYEHLRPKEREKRPISSEFNFDNIKPWVFKALTEGLDPTKGRNKQWFSIACEFALAGYSEDDTMDILSSFFSEDRDFKEREWRTAINSAFKHMYNDRK